MKRHRAQVTEEADGLRLDVFLSRALPGLSRSQVQKLLDSGRVTGPASKASDRVREGWVFDVLETEVEQLLAAEDVPFEIVFEDEHLVVVDKPPGVVVHPAAGHPSGTLVQGLLKRVGTLAQLGSPLRPGIVHRLDKDTSGLLVVARTDLAYQSLAAQIGSRKARREYLALVCGHMKESKGEIDAAIGRSRSDRRKMTVDRHGRQAQTRYSVSRPAGPCDLVQLVLGSGRTHQIRVHLCHIGKPVFGDPIYGGRGGWAGELEPTVRVKVQRALALLPRQALHATRLTFEHPHDGRKVTFNSPMPLDMKGAVEILSA
jgi:23S rRNA pseudouridine1911/1915/1917 synthase